MVNCVFRENVMYGGWRPLIEEVLCYYVDVKLYILKVMFMLPDALGFQIAIPAVSYANAPT
ncbi:hypothetical protein [Nostoc sp.]|uniref:hypothetical protein n=1 Tax=Nostoc sp. TaxID=1180 RepID=UPI002FF72E61